MPARDEILARLRQQAKYAAMPLPWQSRQQFDDLAGQFVAALTAARGEAYRVHDLDEGLSLAGDLLQQVEAERVVVNSEFPLDGVDLPGRWPAIHWHVVGESQGDLRAFCAAADVGLSGADAALAETGSVIISSGPGRSRLATLLPAVHIALVSTSRLTSDIFTWSASRQGTLPANVTLVSGPSKTADIEQTMTVGIHGPKRFIVILYDD